MKAGPRTEVRRGVINYKELRRFNAETARMFGITRAVVYDILKKERDGDLIDRSRAPRHQPKKTLTEIEDRVVAVKNRTHFRARETVTVSSRAREDISARGYHPAYPEKEQGET